MNKPNVNVMIGGPINEDYPRVYKTKYIKPLIPLSGQITDANTKYVIRYNHNLDGEEVIVPEGCLIEFDGGSITNGTLVGDNTILIYSQDIDTIMPDVTLKGTFKYNNGGGNEDRSIDDADGKYSQGQITLKENIINGVNVLTQSMFLKEDPDNPGAYIQKFRNTVVIVKYDFYINEDSFDLFDPAPQGDKYLTLPFNTVLKFEGGCFHIAPVNGVRPFYYINVYQNSQCSIIEDGHMILDYVSIGTRLSNDYISARSIGVTLANKEDNAARLNRFYMRSRCGIVLDELCQGAGDNPIYLIEKPIRIPSHGGKIKGVSCATNVGTILTPKEGFVTTYPDRGVIETDNYWNGLTTVDDEETEKYSQRQYTDYIEISNLQVRCNFRSDYGIVVWACGENTKNERLHVSSALKGCIFMGGQLAVGRLRLCFTANNCFSFLPNAIIGVGYCTGTHPRGKYGTGDFPWDPDHGGDGAGGSISLIECSGDSDVWFKLGRGHYAVDIVAPKIEFAKWPIVSDIQAVVDGGVSGGQIHLSGARIQFQAKLNSEPWIIKDGKGQWTQVINPYRHFLTTVSPDNLQLSIMNCTLYDSLYMTHYTTGAINDNTVGDFVTRVGVATNVIPYWNNYISEQRGVILYDALNRTYHFNSNKFAGDRRPGGQDAPQDSSIIYKPAIGYCFFDKNLMRPIWYTGDNSGNKTGWANADGSLILEDDLYVDLELPSGTLWARRNIDITNSAEGTFKFFTANLAQYECSFFSWGNVIGYNADSNNNFVYDWGPALDNTHKKYSDFENHPYCATSGYAIENDIPVDAEHDAARAILGSKWRLPIYKEVQELFTYCDFVDMEDNIISGNTKLIVLSTNVLGFRLKSKINGKIICFPACGYGVESNSIGKLAEKASITHIVSSTTFAPGNSYFMGSAINTNGVSNGMRQKGLGMPIRPVRIIV